MTIDELVKLMLASGLTISLVGISVQIMRLVGKLVSMLQDLRPTLQNVSKVSDMVVEDYNELRGVVRSIINLLKNFQAVVLQPLNTLVNWLGKLRGKTPEAEQEVTEQDVTSSM